MNKFLKKLFVFILLFFITYPTLNASEYGWGFKRNNEHKTPDIGKYAKIIEGTSSYYVGPTNQKVVYLTFDAGYDNGVMGKILDVLKEKNVKATFFITGDFVVREQELVKRLANEGHIVANHSWSHRYITRLNDEELKEDLEKVEIEYEKLTNKPMTKFFRPPAGVFNRESLLKVQKWGYITFFWSLAYKDWDTGNQRGGDFAYKSVMDNLHNGAIILMHTVSTDNLNALPRIIDDIRKQGYVIGNLDELIFYAYFN